MSSRARFAVAIFALLVVISLLPSTPSREATPSSFGERPSAHGALFELLVALDFEPRRVMVPPARLPAGAVWWIEPDGVCDARIAKQGDVDILDEEAVRWPVGEWIARGHTAVVLLEPEGAEQVRCDAILGAALPERRGLWGASSGDHRNAAEAGADADGDPVWDGSGHPRPGQSLALATVEGDFVAGRREIPAAGVRAFDALGDAETDWSVVATIAPRGGEPRPFALEQAFGKGRLVVLADAAFVRNRRLDLADAAPLAIDLARAYGAPAIDERAHGFVAESSAVRYVAGSPAMPVFAGLALLGLLLVWRGGALPARALDERDEEAPTVAAYLRSMAQLYARSRDHAAVAERYRELCEARVRRHFGLPPDASTALLADRIERSCGLSRERIARLATPGLLPVDSAATLRRAAAKLDALVEEVIH